MKLPELTLRMVRQALRVYCEEAYPEESRQLVELEGEGEDSLECALPAFLDETPHQEGSARRYALRLGNGRYPFMKFVVEEHLIRGEYFLGVDTHDQMFADADDQGELQQLRTFNLEVKRRIELRWRELDLPTVVHLRGLLETRLPQRLPARGQRILVVDDDELAGDTLGLLLEGRGFDVDRTCDGARALDILDPERHSLVVMDVEMPVMDGVEACRRIKADERTRGVPVLLATAGALDLRTVHPADAFLVKPFQAEILFSFLEHLIGGCDAPGAQDSGDGAPSAS